MNGLRVVVGLLLAFGLGKYSTTAEAGVIVTTDMEPGWANVFVSGEIVPTRLHLGVSITPAENPVPGNLGVFYLNMYANGVSAEDGVITNEMHRLEEYPRSLSAMTQTNEVAYDSEWRLVFGDVLDIHSQLDASYVIDGLNSFGWMALNVFVTGGEIVEVNPQFTEIVTGNGPKDAIDWEMFAAVTGIITSSTFALRGSPVPEPATLTMLVLGGIGALYRGRRRLC